MAREEGAKSSYGKQSCRSILLRVTVFAGPQTVPPRVVVSSIQLRLFSRNRIQMTQLRETDVVGLGTPGKNTCLDLVADQWKVSREFNLVTWSGFANVKVDYLQKCGNIGQIIQSHEDSKPLTSDHCTRVSCARWVLRDQLIPFVLRVLQCRLRHHTGSIGLSCECFTRSKK